MTIGERIISIANSYLINNNFSQSEEYQSVWLQDKKDAYGWNDAYSMGAWFTEIVWKQAYGPECPEWTQIDRLFSPSPISTHTNFRGSRHFRTGAMPELGALAIWKNGWHSYMGIVVSVSHDGNMFDMIIAQLENNKIRVNLHFSRQAQMEYKKDGYNLVGFVYPKEI